LYVVFVVSRLARRRKLMAYVFGSNEFGKLGLGAEVRCAPRPTLLASIPDPVAQVCLGSVYGACVTTTQRLYTWGFGRSGAIDGQS
jgi:alpha-tubulin suppressor-like RCC1 family protein